MRKIILGVVIIVILIVTLFSIALGENVEYVEEGNKASSESQKDTPKIGYYVAYKTNPNEEYISVKAQTGYSENQIFKTTGKEKWRILNVLEDGSIILISEQPIKPVGGEGYFLFGEKGYINGCIELDNIAKIYGNGNKAVNARSLTREDINNVIGIENFAKFYNVDIQQYGTTEEQWEAIYKTINKNYGEELSTASKKEVINSYEVDFCELIKDDVVLQNVLNGKYWLANKTIEYYSSSFAQNQYNCFNYGLAYVNSSLSNDKTTSSGKYYNETLFASDNYSVGNDVAKSNRYIRPVVVLDKNVKIIGGTGLPNDPFIIE